VKNSINFSLWLDFIERDFIKSGEFKKLITDGIIDGATSNPAIFSNSILNSEAYKSDIAKYKSEGLEPKRIYELLAIEDIRLASDELLPLYKSGKRGFVSIEIDPFLADDVQGSIDEGVRLHNEIGRENVMIKVPATSAGYKVMEELVARDIDVNATLIFSMQEAIECAEAIKRGQERAEKGSAQTVLSVFVSRLDVATSSKSFGLINSSMIYREIQERGYKNTTVLFASTGVKDPELPAEYYVERLMATNTINTAPLKTIQAFVDADVEISDRLPISGSEVKSGLAEVIKNGHSAPKVLSKLKSDGLVAFENSFRDMLDYLK
jgi:transaldolase